MLIWDRNGCKLTQGLSANFPAFIADLVPGAGMHLVGTITELASERNDLSDDQLGDTS